MDPKENLENTKEIKNLDELRKSAIDTLELTQELLEELDENMESATSSFEKQIDNLEKEQNMEPSKDEPKKDNPEKKQKSWQQKFKAFKEKWNQLSKGKKIGILLAIFIIIVLIVLAIIFLLPKKQESTLPKEPDVIVKENNYRYENGTLIFLDKNKQEIGKYECQNKDQEKCYVAWNSKEDDFDEPKKFYEDGEKIVNRTHFILDQYAFVYDNEEKENGLITLYDFTVSKTLDTYALVKEYASLEEKVILKNKSNQYGLYQLTKDGIESIVPNTYDYLGIIENNKKETNKIVAKRNNKWYLTDLQDKTLTKALDSEIKDYNDNHIKIKDENGFYHLVDYNNVEINPDNYEYIDIIENYILFIKDQKMLIEDNQNHKMHMNPITLYNKTYLPISTYSKSDQKQLKTEKSYEISYQGNIMKIEVQKESDTEKNQINLNEGRVSATLDKTNYFDGILYLYEDNEKKNLLGTYQCSNKNTIGDETTELNNCKIAKESFYQENDIEKDQSANLGTLPIYNKRFAFIQDGTSTNPNIVLYDLKTSETKARYKSVDAGAYTKNNQVNHVTTNGNIVLAETQNNKYGAIKIDYENVSAAIGFNYNHLERIGFYYLAQDVSGYYLVDQNGKRITEAATNKIANYNDVAQYVTRKSGQEYFLYPFDGKGIGSGQSYIALYDTHYATVSNDTLKLFSYSDPNKNLLENQNLPTLKNKNYQGEGTLAFKISIHNQKANIEIAKEDGTYESFQVNLTKENETPEMGGQA